MTLHWQPAATGGDIAAYVIRRDGEVIGASFAGEAYEDLTVRPATSYTYTVEAVDDLGRTGPSSSVLAVVTPELSDLVPPTAPLGLRATRTTTGVRLTWSASVDDIGVQGYSVYDGASWMGTTSATSLALTPPAGSTHLFTVRAIDTAGNLSGPSNIAAA
ncbi:MAG: hypothetical protein HZB15_15560 [Actinobacteria bacterium]|nr:hypothetical protein [Actinomycetota bacterium]